MKKTLAIILSLVMVLAICVPAFAAEGDFIFSPGKKPTDVVDSKSEHEDCPGEIVITPYPERDKLDDESKKEIEDAYEDISKETDEWKKLIEEIAKQLGVDPEDIGVVDLVDIGFTGCDEEGHEPYTITIDVQDLGKFAGLVQYVDGNWQLVLGASAEDGRVTFTVSKLSPVAILADTSAVSSPQTDDSLVWICAAMMISSLIGLAVIVPGFAKKER